MNNRHVVRLRTRAAVFISLSVLLLAADRLTKLWALSALEGDRHIYVIPWLSLSLVRNPGASLGMGSSVTWLISCLAVAACVILAVLALRTSSLAWCIALSLGFAGALGNLVDRVVYANGFLNGHVVDFLDYGWSVGNVADVVLTVAGVAIVVLIVVGEPFGVSANTLSSSASEPKDGGVL